MFRHISELAMAWAAGFTVGDIGGRYIHPSSIVSAGRVTSSHSCSDSDDFRLLEGLTFRLVLV